MSAANDIEFRPDTYKGWSALRVAHGPLTLILVPQVGGRVMGIEWRGRALAFVNPEYEGQVQDLAAIRDVHEFKQCMGFVLWGGDKTWLAPQNRWTDGVPFIDLDSGAYTLAIDHGTRKITMTSPRCRETGIQIERTLRIGEQPGSWTMSHKLSNRSDGTATWAPWDVAMLLRPATVYMSTRAGSNFPQGLRTFENEGVSAAVRDKVVSFADGLVIITCRDAVRFKYGVDAEIGAVLAVIGDEDKGQIGLRKSVPVYDSKPYADGCVVEAFNSPDYPYFELELLGPLVTLAPGESFTLKESAQVFDIAKALPAPGAVRHLLGV